MDVERSGSLNPMGFAQQLNTLLIGDIQNNVTWTGMVHPSRGRSRCPESCTWSLT